MLGADHPQAKYIWFCVRAKGLARRHGWTEDVSVADLPRHLATRRSDVIETCVVNDRCPVATDRWSRIFRHHDRDLLGIKIVFRNEVVRLASTHILTANISFKRAPEKFLKRLGDTSDDFAVDGRLYALSARQLLIPGDGEGKYVALFRGGTLIDPTASNDEDRAADLANGIGQWMVESMSA